MKKTLLLGLLLAGAGSMMAQKSAEVTCKFFLNSSPVGGTCTTTVVENEPGNITIQDFANTGVSLSLTYEAGSDFTPAAPYGDNLGSFNDNSNTLLNEDGEPVVAYIYDEGSETPAYSVYAPHILTGYSTLVTTRYEGSQEFLACEVSFEGYNEATYANPTGKYKLQFPMPNWDEITGVTAVEAEDSNAPVEYFNLQGVRVNNPENGMFIRRQGNTITKVIK